MKFVTVFLAFAIFVISMVASSPVPNDGKCASPCDQSEYKPVCGTDENGVAKTFTNNCVLKVENCLRGLSYQKTADGSCP